MCASRAVALSFGSLTGPEHWRPYGRGATAVDFWWKPAVPRNVHSDALRHRFSESCY